VDNNCDPRHVELTNLSWKLAWSLMG
jgi:hypothetical protein